MSQSGGWEPVWSRDGKELYYRNLEGSELMVVAVQAAPALEIGEPERLLDTPRMPPPVWYGALLQRFKRPKQRLRPRPSQDTET